MKTALQDTTVRLVSQRSLFLFHYRYVNNFRWNLTKVSLRFISQIRISHYTLGQLYLYRPWLTVLCNFLDSISPWQRGLCYTFNSGAPGHPLLDVTSSGKTQALSLIIDVQPNEYYGPFSYEGTGLKVLLHDQNEWPEIENLGMDVTPGYNTNIRIQRSKVIMESWDGAIVIALASHPLYYAPDAICGLGLLLVLTLLRGFLSGFGFRVIPKLSVVFLEKNDKFPCLSPPFQLDHGLLSNVGRRNRFVLCSNAFYIFTDLLSTSRRLRRL